MREGDARRSVPSESVTPLGGGCPYLTCGFVNSIRFARDVFWRSSWSLCVFYLPGSDRIVDFCCFLVVAPLQPSVSSSPSLLAIGPVWSIPPTQPSLSTEISQRPSHRGSTAYSGFLVSAFTVSAACRESPGHQPTIICRMHEQ
jgi:hypothetical protein